MPRDRVAEQASRVVDELVGQSQCRRPVPTAALDRRREQTQATLRRELVTRAAASRARASLVWTHDQRPRPAGLTDAEWACVLVRDADPGTAAAVIAVALACEVADRAEARVAQDPRQIEMFREDGE
jgi:hypothetical protein